MHERVARRPLLLSGGSAEPRTAAARAVFAMEEEAACAAEVRAFSDAMERHGFAPPGTAAVVAPPKPGGAPSARAVPKPPRTAGAPPPPPLGAWQPVELAAVGKEDDEALAMVQNAL
eukprot:4626150-Prymnesium_polylepis.1